MFNSNTKFEVSTTTCNEHVKGNAKCKNSHFEPPFGGLRGNVIMMVHLWLVGKRVVDFLLVLIELLSLAITVEALWADIGRNRCVWKGVDHFQCKFQEKRGVQIADLSHENFKSSRVIRWWLSRLSRRFGAKSSRERRPKWLPGLLYTLCNYWQTVPRIFRVAHFWVTLGVRGGWTARRRMTSPWADRGVAKAARSITCCTQGRVCFSDDAPRRADDTYRKRTIFVWQRHIEPP